MQLSTKTHDKDDWPRHVAPGDHVAAKETDILIADERVQVQWREVQLDPETGEHVEAGSLNGPYFIPAGKDLGDSDPLKTGFGKRRTQPGSGHAIEVIVTSQGRSQEVQVVLLTPEEKHLHEDEVLVMAKNIGSVDYFLDHAVAGLGNIETFKDTWQLKRDGKPILPKTPLARAKTFAAFWTKLEATYTRCLGNLPTRPSIQRALGDPGRGRQDPTTIRRNLSEGRIDRHGRLLREPVHVVSRTRDHDTPTAAALIAGARQMNALLLTLRSELSARVEEQLRSIAEARASGQVHQKVKRKQDAELRNRNAPLDQLVPLQTLVVPATLSALKSTPTQHTAMAHHDPDHREWFRLLAEAERLMDVTETLARAQRLEASARRRTWELYEYWVIYKFYTHLTETLRFKPLEPAEENSWRALEHPGRQDGTIYGLRPNSHITLRHDSGLQIRLSVEPELLTASEGRRTPDLLLELCGDTRDVTTSIARNANSPGLRALVVDAKMQSLHAKPGHALDKLQKLLKHSTERYQEGLRHRDEPDTLLRFPDSNEVMAFLAHVGDINKTSNEDRFRAWPVREYTRTGHASPDAGVPPGLAPHHLPYLNGVLLLRPAADTSVNAQYGDSDVHRVITAWLIENRITWICVHCGKDFLQVPESELYALTQQAHKDRSGNKGLGPTSPGIGDGKGKRKGELRDKHIACPECEQVVVISHCNQRGGPCHGEDNRPTLIFKQFGTLAQQKEPMTPKQRGSWRREEIAEQGTGQGRDALWSRPCPRCGREKD